MILAAFPTEQDLVHAAAQLRAQRIGTIETYTPTEPEELESPAAASSWIPLAVLILGVLGAAFMFLLQSFATGESYPLDIGGRPNLSWPAYIPASFEIGALSAVIGGFLSYLFANRMPCLYRPIDELDAFRNASRDGYFLTIGAVDTERARALLAALHPALIEELPE